MKAYRTLPLLAALTLGLPAAASAQSRNQPSEISLGQAVTRVQQETSGQVLSAESRRWNRRTEYRIKVLTPEGHVRVMTVPASGEGARLNTPSNRTPSERHAGGKEKH